MSGFVIGRQRLAVSPRGAVRAMLEKQFRDGMVEQPDVAPEQRSKPKVHVRVVGPNVQEFLNKNRKSYKLR